MAGTRDLIERKAFEERHAAEVDHVSPPLNTGTKQIGTSTSVRGKQDAKDFAAAGPEVLAPNMSNHRNGMTAVMGFSTSVRDRAILAASKAEEIAKPAVDTTIADYWLNLHKAREAEAAAKRAEEIRTGKLIIL